MMSPFRFLWRKRRSIIIGAVLLFTFPMVSLAVLRIGSAGLAKEKIFAIENVSNRPVAIIFGAWVDPHGNPSRMLADRIKTGAELYQAGKVKALLLTGDNHVTWYNEPEAMRQYALSLGVPDSALVLDYAGFRTYDSCYRAHAIFKVDQAILVTQAFHLDRALLICNGLGIDSVGVVADVVRPEGYGEANILPSEVRELPSTAFALFDLISARKPTFLGDPLPIFTNR
ncbi:MAG: ElyC/SanA/YdcF family protein [Chloroflexota bacterium]